MFVFIITYFKKNFTWSCEVNESMAREQQQHELAISIWQKAQKNQGVSRHKGK